MQQSVQRHSKSGRTTVTHYLVLIEGVREHMLGETLTRIEKAWIAKEVNEVLENIEQT